MLISKKCIYALRAIFELADRNESGPVKIHAIAEAQNIPPRFLEIILAELKSAGFVQSRRGNEGGYLLNRSPADITIGSIIRFVQGPEKTVLQETEHLNGNLDRRGDRAFKELWENVIRQVNQIYDDITIADLLAREKVLNENFAIDYCI